MSTPEHPQHHPHSSPEARAVALRGTVLRVQVGSGVHGTSISGQDDRDEMGLCLEPPASVTGVGSRFAQYEYHTAWERPGGLANRSGAGDLDVVVYSARKWARLALAGNPTVLLPLFVPDDEVVVATAAGRELRANTDKVASKLAGAKFLGYMQGQRRRMTAGGFAPKPAMHALRLGLQGLEYLATGRITLPVPQPHLARLREVRRGEWDLDRVLAWQDELDAELTDAVAASPLPDEPDVAWVDAWLHRSQLRFWETGAA